MRQSWGRSPHPASASALPATRWPAPRPSAPRAAQAQRAHCHRAARQRAHQRAAHRRAAAQRHHAGDAAGGSPAGTCHRAAGTGRARTAPGPVPSAACPASCRARTADAPVQGTGSGPRRGPRQAAAGSTCPAHLGTSAQRRQRRPAAAACAAGSAASSAQPAAGGARPCAERARRTADGSRSSCRSSQPQPCWPPRAPSSTQSRSHARRPWACASPWPTSSCRTAQTPLAVAHRQIPRAGS